MGGFEGKHWRWLGGEEMEVEEEKMQEEGCPHGRDAKRGRPSLLGLTRWSGRPAHHEEIRKRAVDWLLSIGLMWATDLKTGLRAGSARCVMYAANAIA